MNKLNLQERLIDPKSPDRRPKRAAYVLPTLFTAGNVFLGRDRAAGEELPPAPHARGLAAVLESYDPARRPVVHEIHAGGPWGLAREYGHTPARELYADECHLCYEVRSALRAAGRHPAVVAPGQCYGENESS